MFTGIVEDQGVLRDVHMNNGNLILNVKCSFLEELCIDQSIAHNGVCLTVVTIREESYQVEAIDETLKKSNLSELVQGDHINLERCLRIGDRLDGHMVQGHVDTTAVCTNIVVEQGSWIFRFDIEARFKSLIVDKGSICVNGVSLTVVDPGENDFSVAIIPYTFNHTNFNQVNVGDKVNIEFDIVGKYIQRHFSS